MTGGVLRSPRGGGGGVTREGTDSPQPTIEAPHWADGWRCFVRWFGIFKRRLA
jgi:hypothetical protein